MSAVQTPYLFVAHQFYLHELQTKVWKNFKIVEENFLDPLRETLKVTRIQYQAELRSKQEEMAGNKSKFSL